jgi:hypothetical protein
MRDLDDDKRSTVNRLLAEAKKNLAVANDLKRACAGAVGASISADHA